EIFSLLIPSSWTSRLPALRAHSLVLCVPPTSLSHRFAQNSNHIMYSYIIIFIALYTNSSWYDSSGHLERSPGFFSKPYKAQVGHRYVYFLARPLVRLGWPYTCLFPHSSCFLPFQSCDLKDLK